MAKKVPAKVEKAQLAEQPQRGILVQRAPSDIYTVMLILAALALAGACFVMYLEIARYGGFGAIKGPA
jgi:hypothetical protein